MFADDTTLMAGSRAQIISMIRDVKAALAKHGLNLNMDKCEVQTNNVNVVAGSLVVDGQSIPIVQPEVGFKVLGTKVTLAGRTSAELSARISAAWGKFHQLWPALGKRDASLTKRLRLFDMTVTQTALWGNESWNLTQKEKSRLKSTFHNMIRRIAGVGRSPEEPWVDWIKRSTRKACREARQVGIRFWLQRHIADKFRWAGHVVRMDSARLARRVTEWRDNEWWQLEVETFAHMRIKRPKRTKWFRWEDDLRRYAAQKGWHSWKEEARKRDVDGKASWWHSHIDEFVRAVVR